MYAMDGEAVGPWFALAIGVATFLAHVASEVVKRFRIRAVVMAALRPLEERLVKLESSVESIRGKAIICLSKRKIRSLAALSRKQARDGAR